MDNKKSVFSPLFKSVYSKQKLNSHTFWLSIIIAINACLAFVASGIINLASTQVLIQVLAFTSILGLAFALYRHNSNLKKIKSDLENYRIQSSSGDYSIENKISDGKGEYGSITSEIEKILENVPQKHYWYEAILDAIPFPISVTDMDMNWTFFNKPAIEIMGKDRAEFIGKQCNNWGADICNTDKCGIASIRKGTNQSFFTQPGVDLDFQVDTAYIKDINGEKIGHIEVVQNITSVKRSAEYNKKEIQRLSKNLKRISVGNLDIDSTIASADEFTQIEHNNFSTIYEDLNIAVNSIKQLIVETNDLMQSASLGEFNKRADITNHQGDFKKVTEGINKVLDKVVEKTFWYEAMLDSIPFPISVTDMDMNWTFFNKPAVDIMGKERADFLGKQCNNWGADICNTEKCGVASLRKGLKQSFFTQPGVDMDFQVDTAYLKDKNGIEIGHIEIVQDISKSKRAAVYNQNEINRLSANLKRISIGDLDIDSTIASPDQYTQNEFNNFKSIYGDLDIAVASIKRLITDTQVLVSASSQGELTKRADVSQHQGDYRKVVEGFNQTLDLVVDPLNIAANNIADIAIGKIPDLINNNYKGLFKNLIENLNTLISVDRNIIDKAKKIADGVLYIKLESRSENDELVDALNNMVETIANVIKNLVGTSSSIASGGHQLNSSAIQISEGTSEQAASSEEVSASMEEMTGAINQNAENSKTAEQMALKIDSSMDVITQSVTETSQSMEKIAEIISIINEIAKKTDLLAINASIEAARAGEFGKGFSVVANEIRKLAENSSNAAKDIEKIIVLSVEHAKKSSVLLNELLPELKRTTTVVQEISAASSEQLENATQVNKAMIQLASVIQQNSAASEELASISEEFLHQSECIKGDISYFKLDENDRDTMDELQSLLAKYTNEIKNIKTQINTENNSYSTNKKAVSTKTPENKGARINLSDLNISDDNFENY